VEFSTQKGTSVTEVLVGDDSSAAAQRALRRAAVEAEAFGAPLHVVHAWTTPIWIGGVPGLGYNILASPEDSQAWASATLNKQLAEARKHWDHEVPLHAETVEGDAKRVLVELSDKASLLVVSGHGDGQVKGLLLGSVSSYLLHHAHCPVMVVPDHGPESTTVRRVVVGVDGSRSSQAALRWGLEAARQHRCPLVVHHVWSMTSFPGGPPLRRPAPEEAFEVQAKAWLDDLIAETLPDPGGVEVRPQVTHGAPAKVLLQHTGPEDLLVLGARGGGGFHELLLGSVAGQCSQHAHGVLVVVRLEPERTGS
jgi:nucleotide-binding universal stress UspA family protein